VQVGRLRHEDLVQCLRSRGVRRREPGHDLHCVRAPRASKRTRQRKTRHSNSAGMDRCLAGTTRARRSRSPAHRRRAERSDVMNPRATRTERDRAPDSARALTEREVAELLGLSVATLRAWRHRGKGPRFLRLGRSVRYLPSDVAEFVRASAVDTRPDSSSDEDSELGELHV
jgi:excisionase family DNA binding protein